MTAISVFNGFFKTAVLGISAVSTCVGTKLSNSVAPAGPAFPYATWKIVPLADRTGQARTSIITRFLVDLKFMDSLPVASNIPAAIAAVDEYFRSSRTFDSGGYRISVRRQSPIDSTEVGSTADEHIIVLGSTYMVTMTKTS
jgi:hypothetical protein